MIWKRIIGFKCKEKLKMKKILLGMLFISSVIAQAKELEITKPGEIAAVLAGFNLAKQPFLKDRSCPAKILENGNVKALIAVGGKISFLRFHDVDENHSIQIDYSIGIEGLTAGNSIFCELE